MLTLIGHIVNLTVDIEFVIISPSMVSLQGASQSTPVSLSLSIHFNLQSLKTLFFLVRLTHSQYNLLTQDHFFT